MKVSGFTFIRNAIQYDFPVVESIKSILPLCDEVVVAVGASEDGTLSLIRSIDSEKIKIIETVWDESLREGGKVLADETNKALACVSLDSDWAFYIQGDELIHEQDQAKISSAMQKYKDDSRVEGLLFDYVHFYGSYRYYGDSRKWYRREIRIVRPNIGVFSYRDAQGFRKKPNQKLHVKACGGRIFHYGWVRPPQLQTEKLKHSWRFWYDGLFSNHSFTFQYGDGIDSLAVFQDTHPALMQPRIQKADWHFEYKPNSRRFLMKNYWLNHFEKLTGIRIGEYKNFIEV
jgi:glycosyltransferase involved in cell wall biosynthesis